MNNSQMRTVTLLEDTSVADLTAWPSIAIIHVRGFHFVVSLQQQPSAQNPSVIGLLHSRPQSLAYTLQV